MLHFCHNKGLRVVPQDAPIEGHSSFRLNRLSVGCQAWHGPCLGRYARPRTPRGEHPMPISCSYYLEPVDTGDLPRRFLEAFAAILAHSNYAPVLDVLCTGQRALRTVRRHLPGLRGERGGARHPVSPVGAAAEGLPPLLHGGRGDQGPVRRALHPHRGAHQHAGRGRLPVHRLPAVQDRVPAGHRPRPDHAPRPLGPGRGGHHPQGAARSPCASSSTARPTTPRRSRPPP